MKMQRNNVRNDMNMNTINGFMEQIMKTSLDALKYQSTEFQEDCYDQVTSKLLFICAEWNKFSVCLLYHLLCQHMDLQEVGGGCEDWMKLAQDRDRWRALVSTVMNLQVPKMRGIS